MNNKTSDKNVANIQDDVKIVKEFIDYAQEVIDDMEYERPVDVTVYQKDLTSMKHILAEREQMLKTINTVEKEKGEWIKAYQEEKDKQFNILINSIPKQKIKDLLTEIQEEYNKLDKEIDKQIKDKNKDYYKCKENIAIMQTLAYCRDKFEGLLEEK